jgi:hypothetical protein
MTAASGPPDDFPPDWRERLTAVLTSPGVTQPSHTSRARAWGLHLVRSAGVTAWMLLWIAAAGLLAGALMPPVPPWAEAAIPAMLIVPVLAAAFAIRPRFLRFGAERFRVWRTENPARALAAATRPPVLYLRSFNFDAATATETGQGGARFLPFMREVLPSVEQNLVAILSRFAPVLAIGRPGELTPPAGAALRFYVDDERWRGAIAALVPLCGIVVWATGHTPGLQWEIAHLVERKHPEQLLLWVHAHVVGGSPLAQQAEWDRFRAICGGVFPQPLPDDIAHVRFIAFDRDWTPRPCPGPGYRPGFSEWWRNANVRGLTPLLHARLARPLDR